MTPQQHHAMETFVNDPIVFPIVMELVKKKAEDRMAQIVAHMKQYPNLPIPLDESNEETGARFKAAAEGIHLVDSIFRELQMFKKQAHKSLINPGR